MTRSIPSGVYAPLPAFFNDQDELGKQTTSLKIANPTVVQGLEMCFANNELDLKAYLEHAICTELLSLANVNRHSEVILY
jgi:hypothetical protein